MSRPLLRRASGSLASVFAAKPPDRPRVFGVGAAKTGTHSLARLFAEHVNTAHEADAETLIALHLARREAGRERPLHTALLRRDRERALHVDASQVNIYLIDDLEHLFAHSRYVLTVRQPYDWLRSMVDDSLRRSVSDTWMRFREMRFAGAAPQPQDAPFIARGLYPLAGYLGYWADALTRVTTRIEPERMLVVQTETIADEADKVAAFCGIEKVSADVRPAFVNPTRFGVLDELDPAFLYDSIEEMCGELTRHLLGAPVRLPDPVR